jgi:salicylate hydroxylase
MSNKRSVLQELGVEIKYASVATSIDFEQASIKLMSGEVFTGDVVLGADGERSMCRDAILEHPDIPFTTGNVVFRLAIPGKELPQTQEILALTKPPSVNLWLGPESHAVTYLLKKDDVVDVVLVCRDNPDAQVLYGPQPADRIELQSKFAEWEPLFGDLLKAEKAMLMKWSLLQINEVEEWCHPSENFALIGDAAHAMLPYL